ncbi:MAG: TonB-dependent siderophore receptor [Pseudomonadota bacterium]
MSKATFFRRSAIAAGCTLLISSLACAQATGQGETIQASGNWLLAGPQAVYNFGGARSVVKRDDFQLSGADSISDVLRTIPGVQVSDNSASGGSAVSLNIGVRGLDGRFSPHTTVLVDGVPVALAPYGQPQLSFVPVSLANVESVDVLRGGGAVRYGPQGMGGIVNFQTRAIPDRDQAMDASVRYNHFEGGNTNAQYSAFVAGRAEGSLGVALMYAGQQGDGYQMRSRDQVNDVVLKFNYPLSSSSDITAKLSYYDVKSQLPGGLTVVQFDADPRQSKRSVDFWNGSRTGIDIDYVNTLSATRQVEVRSYFNQGSMQSVLANGFDGAATLLSNHPRNYNVLGVEPRYTQRLVWGAVRNDVTLGYRYLQERGAEKLILVPKSGTSTISRNAANNTDAHALYIDDQVAYGQWRVTPGLRYEHIALDRTNVATNFETRVGNAKVLPSLNVAYLLDGSTTVFANYNTSLGSVQHAQLNLQASADALQPETARSMELGARYRKQQWQLEGTLFNLDFSDQVVVVNTAPVFYKNIGKTRHRGLETRAEYAFEKSGKLAGLSAYATYAYTKAVQRQGVFSGNDVPFYSRNVDTEGARYKVGNFVLDLSSSHQSKQYADEANTVAESANGANGIIPGYRLWNANLSFILPGEPRYEMQVGVNNLADKRTYTRIADGNLGKLAGASRMVYAQLRTAF